VSYRDGLQVFRDDAERVQPDLADEVADGDLSDLAALGPGGPAAQLVEHRLAAVGRGENGGGQLEVEMAVHGSGG